MRRVLPSLAVGAKELAVPWKTPDLGAGLANVGPLELLKCLYVHILKYNLSDRVAIFSSEKRTYFLLVQLVLLR
jgi:hypothetical protein